jgi:hypothetical protein
MALTDEEFRAWCQRNKIEPGTITYIQRIRSSEPERKEAHVLSTQWSPPVSISRQAQNSSPQY